MPWTPRHSERIMVALGGSIGALAVAVPTGLLRGFGVPASEITGPGRLGWQLFGCRNLYLTARAIGGDSAALDAFGHLQALDQAVFWRTLWSGSVPRHTTALAIATSAAIVGLDAHRRSGASVPRR